MTTNTTSSTPTAPIATSRLIAAIVSSVCLIIALVCCAPIWKHYSDLKPQHTLAKQQHDDAKSEFNDIYQRISTANNAGDIYSNIDLADMQQAVDYCAIRGPHEAQGILHTVSTLPALMEKPYFEHIERLCPDKIAIIENTDALDIIRENTELNCKEYFGTQRVELTFKLPTIPELPQRLKNSPIDVELEIYGTINGESAGEKSRKLIEAIVPGQTRYANFDIDSSLDFSGCRVVFVGWWPNEYR